MNNVDKNHLPEDIREKIDLVKNDKNELVEIYVKFSPSLEFPSIKAAEFIVGIGNFIDSVPSLFSESQNENIYEYMFFYSIPIGNRKNIENEIYSRFFNDSEIETLDIYFLTEEIHEVIDPNNESNQQLKTKTIYVDVDKLNKTTNLMGELNICTTRFKELYGKFQNIKTIKELSLYSKQLEAVTRQLEEITMHLNKNSIYMQMVSLETVISKLKRIVRNYCRETNKKIKIKTINANIQIDKRIIDKLSEPMIHIIRNAMDHGIEYPDIRIKKGKPDEGTITISGLNRGGKAIIEITDDGKGIDHEIIRAACLIKGIYPENIIPDMSKDELLQALFLPGFSTAENVTDISGRGIGLDVVKNAILQMNGKIYLNSEIDKFTKVTLSLPETLSLVKTIFVEDSGETFALPAKCIERIVELEPDKLIYEDNQIFFKYKILKIPVYAISKLFKEQTGSSNYGKKVGLIAKKDKDLIILQAERLIEIRDAMVKSFGFYMGDIPGFSGGIISSDGKIIFLIDTDNLDERINEYTQ